MPQLVRAKHVRDAGLMSYHELKNFEPARAEQLRDLISQSPGATCLSSVGAFEGVVDSGASKFATSDPMDFVEGTYEKDKAGTMMKGIAGGLQIVGRGTVRYEVMDHNGVIQIITGEGLHVEGLPCRLIPPQKAMPTDDDGDFRINGQRAYFMFANTKGRASTPFDPSTGLPTIALMHDVNTAAKRLDRAMYSCVTEENNQNLTPSQKEALRWHFRLGHPGMQVVNWLARRGFTWTIQLQDRNYQGMSQSVALVSMVNKLEDQLERQERKQGETRSVESPMRKACSLETRLLVTSLK